MSHYYIEYQYRTMFNNYETSSSKLAILECIIRVVDGQRSQSSKTRSSYLTPKYLTTTAVSVLPLATEEFLVCTWRQGSTLGLDFHGFRRSLTETDKRRYQSHCPAAKYAECQYCWSIHTPYHNQMVLRILPRADVRPAHTFRPQNKLQDEFLVWKLRSVNL